MRIAIVNDLRIAQEILRQAVIQIPGASVAWVAVDGRDAIQKCKVDQPDLILMDMVMPVMDGAVATRGIMKECPCPILVVTSSIEGNLALVYEALSAGAIDAVHTPTMGPNGTIQGVEALARKARVAFTSFTVEIGQSKHPLASAIPMSTTSQMFGKSNVPLVVIGSSTGGPNALSVVLRGLSVSSLCCTVIVQHIDVAYAPGLAQWLSGEIKRPVKIAEENQPLSAGSIVIASTADHLVLRSCHLHYCAEPVEYIFRPSVDVFFESVVKERVQPSVAILLTGMGRDGAQGMRSLRDAGWHTIAQDQESSVVWGMPGSAVEMGGAVEILPLDQIGAAASRSLSLRFSEHFK
ncbi:MAG: chemotaxis-specific protein-glutamate methyltransferase CheB [Planctomycetota bacterium]|nr:chemotaxis-specific protein-glutamate methyltransferase CheB [Planctomycetota bacterium]